MTGALERPSQPQPGQTVTSTLDTLGPSSEVGGYERVGSVRINEQYRAIGERQGDTIIWVWIGTHNEFDNLFG